MKEVLVHEIITDTETGSNVVGEIGWYHFNGTPRKDEKVIINGHSYKVIDVYWLRDGDQKITVEKYE